MCQGLFQMLGILFLSRAYILVGGNNSQGNMEDYTYYPVIT